MPSQNSENPDLHITDRVYASLAAEAGGRLLQRAAEADGTLPKSEAHRVAFFVVVV